MYVCVFHKFVSIILYSITKLEYSFSDTFLNIKIIHVILRFKYDIISRIVKNYELKKNVFYNEIIIAMNFTPNSL